MRFRCQNVFNCDAETYWTKIFFDTEYNDALYRNVLGFKAFEVQELTGETGGDRTRRTYTEPKADAPAVVTKLIGGGLAYTERGRFDAKAQKWSYEITTNKLSDRVRIGGTLWVEPRGDRRIERICEVDLEVKVLGIGGVVEKYIADTTRDSYEKTAVYTNEFIAKKGL